VTNLKDKVTDQMSQPLVFEQLKAIGFTLALAIGIAEAAGYRTNRDRARLREIVLALALSGVAVAAWYALRPAGGDDAYVSSSAGVIERLRTEGLAYLGSLAAGNARAVFDAWLNTLVIYWGEPWQPKFLGGALIAAAMAAATLRRA